MFAISSDEWQKVASLQQAVLQIRLVTRHQHLIQGSQLSEPDVLKRIGSFIVGQ